MERPLLSWKEKYPQIWKKKPKNKKTQKNQDTVGLHINQKKHHVDEHSSGALGNFVAVGGQETLVYRV